MQREKGQGVFNYHTCMLIEINEFLECVRFSYIIFIIFISRVLKRNFQYSLNKCAKTVKF
jgi:hypothetical protein